MRVRNARFTMPREPLSDDDEDDDMPDQATDGDGSKRKCDHDEEEGEAEGEEAKDNIQCESSRAFASILPSKLRSAQPSSAYSVDVIADDAKFLNQVAKAIAHARDVLASDSDPTKLANNGVPSEVMELASRISECVASIEADMKAKDGRVKKRAGTIERKRLFHSTHTVSTKTKVYKILFDLALFTIDYGQWEQGAYMMVNGSSIQKSEEITQLTKTVIDDVTCSRQRATLGYTAEEIAERDESKNQTALCVEVSRVNCSAMLLEVPKKCKEMYLPLLQRYMTVLDASKKLASQASSVHRLARDEDAPSDLFAVRGKDRKEEHAIKDWTTLYSIYSRSDAPL
jgi:hypothetical protein